MQGLADTDMRRSEAATVLTHALTLQAFAFEAELALVRAEAAEVRNTRELHPCSLTCMLPLLHYTLCSLARVLTSLRPTLRCTTVPG